MLTASTLLCFVGLVYLGSRVAVCAKMLGAIADQLFELRRVLCTSQVNLHAHVIGDKDFPINIAEARDG
jgi:hypothetical protein